MTADLKTLQHNPGLGSVTMSTEQAAALLKSSKPAAGPEGEITCFVIGDPPPILERRHLSHAIVLRNVYGGPNDYGKGAGLRFEIIDGKGILIMQDVGIVPSEVGRKWLESRTPKPAPAATDFRGTIAPGTTISVDVGPGQNLSPAESEGKPDWADWMATNEYHQSLGAKWICEAIVSKYAPDEREFVHAFARKWEDASFWRPTEPTASTDGKGCQATRTSASGQLLTCSLPAHSEGLHKSPEGWNWAMPESSFWRPTEPAPTAKPCPLKECSETAPHSHAPNTGWIRPDSWDYENNRPRETAPAATQAPELVKRLRVVRVLEIRYASASVEITMPSPQGTWPHARGTEYVRADLLEAAEAKLDHSQRKYRASCRHIEELAREDEEKRARLEAAERRIAELEGANAAMQVDLADFTNAAFANGLVEGREAGIREAAYAEMATRGRRQHEPR